MFAVIFDMDGVMVDNLDYHFRAWQMFLEKNNISITRQQLRDVYFGMSNNEIFKILFLPNLSEEESRRLSNEKEKIYRGLYSGNVRLVKGLKEFLNMLGKNNVKTAIATSAPGENVTFLMKETGLNHSFETIVDATSVKKAKPDPEIFLKTASKLSMPPEKCIVIEDSRNGIKAARNACMKVIALTTSLSREEIQDVDLITNDFADLSLASLIKLFD